MVLDDLVQPVQFALLTLVADRRGERVSHQAGEIAGTLPDRCDVTVGAGVRRVPLSSPARRHAALAGSRTQVMPVPGKICRPGSASMAAASLLVRATRPANRAEAVTRAVYSAAAGPLTCSPAARRW